MASNAENVSIWWRHHKCRKRFHGMTPHGAWLIHAILLKWRHIGLWCGFHGNESIVKCIDESNVSKVNNVSRAWNNACPFNVIYMEIPICLKIGAFVSKPVWSLDIFVIFRLGVWPVCVLVCVCVWACFFLVFFIFFNLFYFLFIFIFFFFFWGGGWWYCYSKTFTCSGSSYVFTFQQATQLSMYV